MSVTREYLMSLDIEENKISAILDELHADTEKTAELSQKLAIREKEIEEMKSQSDTIRRRTLLAENLEKSGYSASAARLIANKSDFASQLMTGDDGSPTNVDEVISAIQADADFSYFTPKIENLSHSPATPPSNSGGGWTKDKIMAIKNTAERQALIAENPRIFGI
ncbi:MAG: hypothetical protein NC205_01015 [Prevotella sp.]|nr:hypothetical protein [Alistipes senegalensis]MCM1357144.1 hypothetical protein [Prevotella sp.]MCM1472655.1 hypothetical protein [Muribaculaceae bacterium]